MTFKKLSLLLIVLMLLMTGCAEKSTVPSYEGALSIVLPNETIEIEYNDIYKMNAITASYKTITSSGEEITTEVVGVSLTTILESYDVKLSDFNGLRGIAGDGYAIDVPKEIISDKDVLLIWSEDGEVYADKKLPLRLAVNDERAMYWVSNLIELQCLSETTEVASEPMMLNQILLIEPASKSLEEVTITYYESEDQGVRVTDLFAYGNPSDPVIFVAIDNFEKTEKLDILNQGLIKLTGENAPLFMSPDLPKGMHVKMILQMMTGDTVYVSGHNAMSVFTSMTVEDEKGVSLIELIDKAGLKGDTYIFTSTDGYSVELSGKDVKKGILIQDGDLFKVKFDGQPKNTMVKDIMSISVGEGQETSEETSDAVMSSWSIQFTGLSDGDFDMTSDRAERKLTLYEIEATKTSKDGDAKQEIWKGYRLLDVLEFLHIESFEELVVTASDGYEVVFTKDQVDENMLLGVVVDGEPLSEESGSVKLVSASLTSNHWVKFIQTIEIK